MDYQTTEFILALFTDLRLISKTQQHRELIVSLNVHGIIITTGMFNILLELRVLLRGCASKVLVDLHPNPMFANNPNSDNYKQRDSADKTITCINDTVNKMIKDRNLNHLVIEEKNNCVHITVNIDNEYKPKLEFFQNLSVVMTALEAGNVRYI